MLVLFPLAFVSLVAPFTGAWIEIMHANILWIALVVAPFTGAWIEIDGKDR